MTPEQFSELASEVNAADLTVSSSVQCGDLLARLNHLRSWVESRTLAVTQRLNELAPAGPRDLSRTDRR